MTRELWVLVAGLVLCLTLGVFSRTTAPTLPTSERPQTPPHDSHGTLDCARCHGQRARPVTGLDRALMCADCHHPLQILAQAPELAQARDAYFAAGCGSCHPVEGALRRTRPGPDLREARIKLTREWTYRFLSEPWAWNSNAPPGPHHLEADVPKMRAIVTALCGNSDRAAYTHRGGDPGLADKLLAQGKCDSCHALDRLGSKVSRTWLEAFLRAPRAHAVDARHLAPRWSSAEVSAVADRLLGRRDPVFEPRWPLLDRATVDATDALVERYLPGSDLQAAAQAKKEAALGERLLQEEGCGGCHALLGSASSVHAIRRDPKRKDTAHAAKYSAQPEQALVFVTALRRHARSDWWPRPKPHNSEGAALSREAGCSTCHARGFGKAGYCDWERSLADSKHDFGLDAVARDAIIGHFAGNHVCRN